MRSQLPLFGSALRLSPWLTASCLLVAVGVGTTACGSPTPPVGTGGAASGGEGSGAAPGTGGMPTSGGAPGDGGTSSGGAGSGGEGSGGAPASGGAGSGGEGSGGEGSGGAPQAVFTCPDGSESLTPDLSGTPTPLPGTLPAVPGGGSNAIMEGPVWIDGALYMSQMRDYGPHNPSNLLQHDGSNYTVFLADSLTNGLALTKDGTILGASHGVGGLVAIDPKSASPMATTVIAEYMGSRLNSPNDLVIRADGHVYFTDPDYQCDNPCDDQADNRVYFYPAGGGALQAIETNHQNPNGITLSLDGSKLYVAGPGGIDIYGLDATTGAVTSGPTAFNTTGLNSVDGLTIDCAGNIYAAANGEVTVLDPSGAAIGMVTVPNSTTNVAFGGPGGTTLYITTMSQAGVYSLDVGIPGSPY